MELHLAFELIENLITFIDVELFAAIGAAVNHPMKSESCHTVWRRPHFSLSASIHC